jgi:hypothetical protein
MSGRLTRRFLSSARPFSSFLFAIEASRPTFIGAFQDFQHRLVDLNRDFTQVTSNSNLKQRVGTEQKASDITGLKTTPSSPHFRNSMSPPGCGEGEQYRIKQQGPPQ